MKLVQRKSRAATPGLVRRRRMARVLSAILVASLPQLAGAATYTWDANTTSAGTGGTGAWSSAFWTVDGATFVNWPGTGNTAIFGGTAGTVTVGTQSANGVTFNTPGYTLSGGTLTLAAGSSVNTATSGGTTTVTATMSSSALTKTGVGTLNYTGGGGPTTWTVTGGTRAGNTFTSVLAVSFGSSLGTAPTGANQVILDAGTLQLTNGGSATPNTNIFANTRAVQVNAAGGAIADNVGDTIGAVITDNAASNSSLFLGNVSGTTTFSGAIGGTGGVTWSGAGSVLFSAANTFAGGLTVNAGAAATNATVGTLGRGNVVIAEGATLTLGNNASLADGALLTFGPSSIVNLNGNGTDTLSAILNSATGVTLNAPGTYSAAQLNAAFGVTSFTGAETLTLVPEPTTLVAAAAAAGIAIRRRRRA